MKSNTKSDDIYTTNIARPASMAAPETETVLPIRDGESIAATEQQIDPWDVQAAHDEHGNVLGFDYVAISQYGPSSAFHGVASH
jgi:hypothetical protein